MLEILTTGGTIDKVYFDKKSNYEVGDPFVEELLHKMNVNISFKVKSLMRIDSLDMTDIHRVEILNYIMNSNSNNFLITHGTDSIVETAIYLKKISDKTIVLTGSLKPAIFIDNDAIFNVGSALTSAQILKKGVYIVINGQVFNPDNVRKNLEKNIFEHISLMAQEQIELEFRQELPQLAQMQQMAQQNPQLQMQVQELSQKIEGRKAVLIANMMEEFLKEEREVTSGFGNDPVAKLRARELDLRAMDNERKRVEGQEKINLDRLRAMMNQQDKQDKLQQNEELANLRADTSIEKTILSKSIPNVDKMIPSVEIEKYKGENR